MPNLRHLATIFSVLRNRYPLTEQDQLRRLDRIVSHVWARNPRIAAFWREHGLSPARVRSYEEFGRYPVTRKTMYQVPVEQTLSEGYSARALSKHPTSGSTGLPLTVCRTTMEDLVLRAFRLRRHFDYGLGWFDTRATMRTGLDAAFGGRSDRSDPGWMRMSLLRVRAVSHLRHDPSGVVARLGEIRPAVLTGHADAIWRLCLEVPVEDLRSLRLKYMTAGVQTVTPDMRRRIADAFGCPLYVSYGASEFNLLASQCPQTGLFHLNEGCNLVEVLKGGRPAADGEEGEVVATNLHAYAIPFVRYALDDWAIAGPSRCPCGAPVRTIREIEGRSSEFFVFSDGVRVHPFQLINPLLEFIGWLREYRLVQVSRNQVDVWYNVLPGAPAEEQANASIELAIGAAAPANVVICAVPMGVIPPGRKGKNQMFVALPPGEG